MGDRESYENKWDFLRREQIAQKVEGARQILNNLAKEKTEQKNSSRSVHT